MSTFLGVVGLLGSVFWPVIGWELWAEFSGLDKALAVVAVIACLRAATTDLIQFLDSLV
ncbi:hypothetical protein [Zavarzinella formosa]|uniref:hypothetical protein n=1 Tax=Zavarzinella formosa TaxID=360055 RepID=UPI001EE6462F|nr:hypothetical protein [Zavarzinella formosa]